MSEWAFLACLAATLYMTGVIVVVQHVHYPLFERVPREAFPQYHAEHLRVMTPIVAVPMVIELMTSVVLVLFPVREASWWLAWAGFLATVVCWLVTAVVAVPLHSRLADRFDELRHRDLVRWNWVRTGGWVVHSIAMLMMTAQVMRVR